MLRVSGISFTLCMETVSLKTLFDTLPGGFLITDVTSRVVYANESVSRRSGFAVAEIIGKKPGELWGGRMKRGFYQSMWQTIGIEKEPFIGRVENKRKDGNLVMETLHIAPLKDSLGTVRYFVELHPSFQNQEESGSFGTDFMQRAKHWHHDESVWDWVIGSLAGPSGWRYDGFRELISLVEEEFIAPTREVFSKRFEDALLIEKAKANPEAFDALYAKYRSSVAGYFLRRLGDQLLSEDLTQEVFARAFRYLPTFRVTNASYLTYLLHICHSILVNHYRRETTRPNILSLATLEEAGEEVTEKSQENMEIMLQALSPVEQRVMLLTYRDGFRVKEVAAKLGKTENAVKLILSRTRKKLRLVSR